MAFMESPRFPEDISQGSRGGPMYNNTRLPLDGGALKRNANWTYPRHEFNVAYGIKRIEQLETLLTFFHVAGGGLEGFRYKDWADFKSCGVRTTPAFTDHIIGTGDGTADQAFQLFKIYSAGSNTKSRKIVKPVSGTILVGWNGAQKTETTDYTIDYTTGIVTATVPNGQTITWGGEFDVPCLFDTDKLDTALKLYLAGETSVPLIEDVAA